MQMLEREEKVVKSRAQLQDIDSLPRLPLVELDCCLPTADLVVE